MRATRRRPSTTEHGHAVSIRGYQSDPWSVERPLRSAPRSYPARAYGGALTGITPYQLAVGVIPRTASTLRIGYAREFFAPAQQRSGTQSNRSWAAIG